jgi:hypothetical protein
MIWYNGTGYTSNSTVIYGNAGTCDRAGYRIAPSSYWKVNISSIARLQTCDAARITNRALNDSAAFFLSTPTIARFDNNVGLVQVYSTYYP